MLLAGADKVCMVKIVIEYLRRYLIYNVILVLGFIFLFVIVLLSCNWDIRYHRVKMMYCSMFMLGNGLMALWMHVPFRDLFIGLIPGIFLLLFHSFPRLQLGMADVYFILGCGLLLGFWNTIFVLMGSLVVASIYGAILLIRNREAITCEIAFIPFLSLFYLIDTIYMGYSFIAEQGGVL